MAYIVENAATAEQMAGGDPQSYFLTPDGTCYHGRTVSGGRPGEAGPSVVVDITLGVATQVLFAGEVVARDGEKMGFVPIGSLLKLQ